MNGADVTQAFSYAMNALSVLSVPSEIPVVTPLLDDNGNETGKDFRISTGYTIGMGVMTGASPAIVAVPPDDYEDDDAMERACYVDINDSSPKTQFS